MNEPTVPPNWPVNISLRTKYVYNSFKILSLLEYHSSHHSHLCVLQTTDQAHQFDEEMERINFEIYTHGQPKINHRCEKCVRTVVIPAVVAEKDKDVGNGNRISENSTCILSMLLFYSTNVSSQFL